MVRRRQVTGSGQWSRSSGINRGTRVLTCVRRCMEENTVRGRKSTCFGPVLILRASSTCSNADQNAISEWHLGANLSAESCQSKSLALLTLSSSVVR